MFGSTEYTSSGSSGPDVEAFVADDHRRTNPASALGVLCLPEVEDLLADLRSAFLYSGTSCKSASDSLVGLDVVVRHPGGRPDGHVSSVLILDDRCISGVASMRSAEEVLGQIRSGTKHMLGRTVAASLDEVVLRGTYGAGDEGDVLFGDRELVPEAEEHSLPKGPLPLDQPNLPVSLSGGASQPGPSVVPDTCERLFKSILKVDSDGRGGPEHVQPTLTVGLLNVLGVLPDQRDHHVVARGEVHHGKELVDDIVRVVGVEEVDADQLVEAQARDCFAGLGAPGPLVRWHVWQVRLLAAFSTSRVAPANLRWRTKSEVLG